VVKLDLFGEEHPSRRPKPGDGLAKRVSEEVTAGENGSTPEEVSGRA